MRFYKNGRLCYNKTLRKYSIKGENGMKRLLATILLSVMLFGLCGCGDYVSLMPGGASLEEEAAAAFEQSPVSQLLGWEGFMSSYYDDTPVALSRKGAEGYASPVFDRESVIRACDALRGMTAVERLEEGAAADGEETVFCFTMADGSTREIRFADRALRCVRGDYAVSGGEALWDIPFPGYDEGFSVFDLYYSDKVTAFAESFDENTPVSVGRRNNGGATLSNQDPAVVRQVFELLSGAVVERVEDAPDQNIDLNNVQDYVFTMEDGSSQIFTFTGGCLTVTADEAVGPVYYHISTGAELQSLVIAAKVNAAAFEGGTLDTLREDIGRAVAVANGEYVEAVPAEEELAQESREEAEAETGESGDESEEGSETESTALSVAGVYVTFLLDGTEDYISLQGEDAAEFVRMLGQMQISADRPELEPGEAPITVSVNLSDWSGPIIYFADGAVQQSVGNWYTADEAQYGAMTDRIMELYWSQVDSRSVETTENTEDADDTESAEGE